MRKDMTPEEQAQFEADCAALTEEAKANWHRPEWRQEAANVITESITWGFQSGNILSYLTDLQYLANDDIPIVRELRGMKAFWIAPGGYIEESTLGEKEFTIPRDTIGFHVSEFEDKLESNFGRTQAELIDYGTQRLIAEINLYVFRLFRAALPIGSAYTTNASGLDFDTVSQGVAEVQDLTNDDVTIVGRADMVRKLADTIINISGTPYGAMIPETNQQLLDNGVVGKFRGANVVTLKAWKDDIDAPFFPANELWIIGKDASKFAFWGAPKNKQFVEDDNWFWHYLERRNFGGLVWRPDRIRRIIDSSGDGSFAG